MVLSSEELRHTMVFAMMRTVVDLTTQIGIIESETGVISLSGLAVLSPEVQESLVRLLGIWKYNLVPVEEEEDEEQTTE